MNKYYLLALFLTGVSQLSAQRFELRPNLLYSFHNIAKVSAVGFRLEGITQVSGRHSAYTSIELLHGEGNQGFQNIKRDVFYSYRFDDPATGNSSSSAHLFRETKLLKVKSSRLLQAALKIGYSVEIPLSKNSMEVGAVIYGNYVSGLYVVDILDNFPNYNPNGGDPIESFVVHYFFNYLDIGPGIAARYRFHTRKKVDPIIGLEYNYGIREGSWAALSLGLKLK
jgi:hypothetical protein